MFGISGGVMDDEGVWENGKIHHPRGAYREAARKLRNEERAQKKADKQLKKAVTNTKLAAELKAAANPPPPRKNPGGIYEKAAKFAEQKRLEEEAANPPLIDKERRQLNRAGAKRQRQETHNTYPQRAWEATGEPVVYFSTNLVGLGIFAAIFITLLGYWIY